MKIKFDFKKNKKGIVAAAIGIVVVGITCFWFFAGTYWVRSNAMLPTLAHGSLVRVTSASTFVLGDMILYKTDRGYDVARIIAAAGDNVRIENGRVSVNGRRLDRALIGETTQTIKLYNGKKTIKQNVRFKRYVETLPNGNRYHILEAFDERARENYTVPADTFFVIGDNRDFSGATRTKTDAYVHITNAKKIKQ